MSSSFGGGLGLELPRPCPWVEPPIWGPLRFATRAHRRGAQGARGRPVRENEKTYICRFYSELTWAYNELMMKALDLGIQFLFQVLGFEPLVLERVSMGFARPDHQATRPNHKLELARGSVFFDAIWLGPSVEFICFWGWGKYILLTKEQTVKLWAQSLTSRVHGLDTFWEDHFCGKRQVWFRFFLASPLERTNPGL